jgi:hypothetical protein
MHHLQAGGGGGQQLTKIASGLRFDVVLDAMLLDAAEDVRRDERPHEVEPKLPRVLRYTTL